MLTLLAAIIFAQSGITLQIGKDKPDSVAKAKRDSIAFVRDEHRDSIMAKERVKDSVRKALRIARRPQVTPAILASAFKDSRARDLLLQARQARLTQDSTLTAYDASTYARMSVGMGFKRIGRDRLLMRSEHAAHVMWQRNKGAVVEVTGQRSALPMIEGIGKGDINLCCGGDIPYTPGRETLWIGPGLAKADVSEDEIIHPLAAGAEAYYTYASGDSVTFQLPGGQRIELRELLIRPRQPKWNVAVGSLWVDAATGHPGGPGFRRAADKGHI